MALFQELRSRAGGLAQEAANKTKQAAQTARINLAISQEQEKIRKAYTELGKLYFEDFQTDKAPEGTDYLLWVGKITAAKARIEALRAQLDPGEPVIHAQTPPDGLGASDGPDLSEIQVVVLEDEPQPASDASPEPSAPEEEA